MINGKYLLKNKENIIKKKNKKKLFKSILFYRIY